MSYLIIFLLIIIITILITLQTFETFTQPTLYPLTGPVDMLIMPKQLLLDGYRFQNTLTLPDNKSIQPLMDYPDNFRTRVGVFKQKAYVEGFESNAGAGSIGASLATLSQLNAKSDQDKYLIGSAGQPIEDSRANLDPMGQWVKYGSPERKREINYPNKPFSWGDIIYRFYGVGKRSFPVPPLL